MEFKSGGKNRAKNRVGAGGGVAGLAQF